MKKKLSLLMTALALFLVLTGCVGGEATSKVTFSSLEGAGTKTIEFAIPQDAATEVTEGTNDEGEITHEYTIYNNSSYFPQGYKAFADFVVGKLPAEDGFRVEVDESNPSDVIIRFSYDFTSFEDYAKKTKDMMGEERWNASSFVAPQVVVTEVKDPADDNFGKLKVTYVESHYMTASSICRLLELGFTAEAAEAGVFAPYGNAYKNADAAAKFKESGEDEKDEHYDTWHLANPSAVCEPSGDRTYVFNGVEVVEAGGLDGMVSFYADPSEGKWTVTDVAAFLKDGQTGDELYAGEDGLYVLTKKADVAEDAAWSLDNYTKTLVMLGTKNAGAQDAKAGEEGDLRAFRPTSSFPTWIIFVIIGVVVAAAAVVVVAVILKKRDADDEDDDEDEDEDDDEDEDEE